MSRARILPLAIAAVVGAAAACTDVELDLDEPQDAEHDAGKADGARQTCARVRCGDPAAPNILFPGNPACGPAGCERHLAGDDLFIPPRNGRPWGDTHQLGATPATTLSGYSSGRIALLRRLALVGDGTHAVLVDPSWNDGARDFAGRGRERGEDIVEAWLAADPARTFHLIYSRRSTGWLPYAALLRRGVGARVQVCSIELPHLLVPTLPDLRVALTDPLAWDLPTCRWGAAHS